VLVIPQKNIIISDQVAPFFVLDYLQLADCHVTVEGVFVQLQKGIKVADLENVFPGFASIVQFQDFHGQVLLDGQQPADLVLAQFQDFDMSFLEDLDPIHNYC
jgi:hypothetical protein